MKRLADCNWYEHLISESVSAFYSSELILIDLLNHSATEPRLQKTMQLTLSRSSCSRENEDDNSIAILSVMIAL